MSQVRGKRRTLAQRVGRTGELTFAQWAVDRGLGANKTDEDFGIDYYCQVFRSIGGGKEEATGAVLSAQVRGTGAKSKRPRIALEKEDAENLLRQTNAACVIGVDVTASKVAFRFVDESFLRELADFVKSDRSTLTLSIASMDSDPALFDERLRQLTRPAAQNRLRLLLTELRLDGIAPGSRVRITQDSVGSRAVVNLPWIDSAFRFSTEAEREPLRQVFFDGRGSDLAMPGSALKPEIHQAFELADEGWLTGKGVETEVELRVRQGEQSATVRATARRIGDEVAYLLDVGLGLVMSGARSQDDAFVHELHGRLFRGQRSLGDAAEVLPFLKLLRDGAVVDVNGKPLMPAEAWGPRIASLGAAVTAIESVYATLSIDLREVFLDALLEEEFGRSMQLLEAVLIHKVPWEALLPGVILGASSQDEVDSLEQEEARIIVPLVLNLHETGIVFRISGPCMFFFTDEGEKCGVRFKGPATYAVERTSRFTKSVAPEMWVRTDWPPVPVGIDLSEGFTPAEHEITLEATVQDKAADASTLAAPARVTDDSSSTGTV